MSRVPKPTRDRHALYQRAVQTPDVDAAFLDRLHRRLVGRPAMLFREDFCGTAALSCAWVELGPGRRAIGVDLDRPTLAWVKSTTSPGSPTSSAAASRWCRTMC